MKTYFAVMTSFVLCTILLFTSCSDEDKDAKATFTYSIGIDSMTTSDLSEMTALFSIYRNALGITGDEFTLTGTQSECDNKVKTACKDAEITIVSQSWNGSYSFSIMNKSTATVIYTYTIQ